MKTNRRQRPVAGNRRIETRRLSISVPPEHHAELQRLARQKRVSLAWVVRDALEKYIAAEIPSVGPGR